MQRVVLRDSITLNDRHEPICAPVCFTCTWPLQLVPPARPFLSHTCYMCRIHATHVIDRHVYTLPLLPTVLTLPDLYTYHSVLPDEGDTRTRAYQRRALCFAPMYTLKHVEWHTPPAVHQSDRVMERVEQVRVYGAPLWWTSTLSSPLDIKVTWTMSAEQNLSFSHDWVTPSGVWVEAGIPLYYKEEQKQPSLQATLHYTFTPGRIGTTKNPRHLELWDTDHKIWTATHSVKTKAEQVLLPPPLQKAFVFESLHLSAPLLCAL